MPWEVYALIFAWLAFAGWLLARAWRRQWRLPGIYLEPDLILKFFAGKLTREQQRLMVRYMLALCASVALLALAIVLLMVAHVGR